MLRAAKRRLKAHPDPNVTVSPELCRGSLKLDPLVADFVIDLDGLTKAGGDVEAFCGLTEYRRAAVAYACRNATWAIKCAGMDGLTGFKIIEDLQARAQKLLADPVRLIQLQCSHKWWH